MVTGKEVRIISLLVLDTVFFLIEAIIGYSVHSLALIADSFHMLNDIISLIVALWAVKVKTTKPADKSYTYGWQRAEILGALINAVFLLALCFTIIVDAVQRFIQPEVINNPQLILVVGIAGLVSNGLGLVLFHEHGHSHSHGSHHADLEAGDHEHGHSHSHATESIEPLVYKSKRAQQSSDDIRELLPERVVSRINEQTSLLSSANGSNNSHNHRSSNKHVHDHDHEHEHEHDSDNEQKQKKKKSMNMEGVFLHVLGDALGNIGVIITALFIWKTDYSWRFYSDPLVSLIITAIIFSSALPLCKNASKILLQATPSDINSDLIIDEILKIKAIKSVHDFHIWNLNEDVLIASLHLELNCPVKEYLPLVKVVREILHKHGIHSATIQPEFKKLDTVGNDFDFTFNSNEIDEDNLSNGSISRKDSVYGSTNQLNCLVDGEAGCDSNNCLKI